MRMGARTFDPKRVGPNPLFAALLIGIGVVGCGDSSTAPADELKPSEAEALLLGMMALVGDTTSSLLSGTPLDGVHACPLGGQTTKTFVSTPQEASGDTIRSTVGFTLDPDRCVLSSEGWEFTVDGNPEFQLVMTISSTGTDLEFSMEATVGGAVDWELDDRRGTCVFDMAFSAEAVQNFAQPQLFGERTGTVCGVDVERL